MRLMNQLERLMAFISHPDEPYGHIGGLSVHGRFDNFGFVGIAECTPNFLAS